MGLGKAPLESNGWPRPNGSGSDGGYRRGLAK